MRCAIELSVAEYAQVLRGINWLRVIRVESGAAMQELPHHYSVTASAGAQGEVDLASEGLPSLVSAPPAEFGGPGDQWSPETLLVAAVADCYILTFRAIARASKLPWISLNCEVEATLDKLDGVTQFTGLQVRATLRVPPDVDDAKAGRLLARAEHGCLITNSLKARSQLSATVHKVSE